MNNKRACIGERERIYNAKHTPDFSPQLPRRQVSSKNLPNPHQWNMTWQTLRLKWTCTDFDQFPLLHFLLSNSLVRMSRNRSKIVRVNKASDCDYSPDFSLLKPVNVARILLSLSRMIFFKNSILYRFLSRIRL